ncbi:hypothetical protein ACJX0J_039451 [Zea mays]
MHVYDLHTNEVVDDEDNQMIADEVEQRHITSPVATNEVVDDEDNQMIADEVEQRHITSPVANQILDLNDDQTTIDEVEEFGRGGLGWTRALLFYPGMVTKNNFLDDQHVRHVFNISTQRVVKGMITAMLIFTINFQRHIIIFSHSTFLYIFSLMEQYHLHNDMSLDDQHSCEGYDAKKIHFIAPHTLTYSVPTYIVALGIGVD